MTQTRPDAALPEWVPAQSRRYLAHVESGRSIRDLARSEGCHPSTISRQIRRLEIRRDDPLVDEVLKLLGRRFVARVSGRHGGRDPGLHLKATDMTNHLQTQTACDDALPNDAELSREGLRILRRMCETGAVLALAADMDKAVVVRDMPGGASARTAVVDRPVAQAMALNEWITCTAPGRISRYTITQAGRSALSRLMAEEESQRAGALTGCAEAPSAFDPAGAAQPARKSRYVPAESPLHTLSRHKDRDGQQFLDDTLVAAGERLREDFELAQLNPSVAQNWDRILTGGVRGGASGSGLPQFGQSDAQDRVLTALRFLGPGLSDVALRCCCFLEGLELAEKHLGWSARSGKIVLRIALQRLKWHYSGTNEADQMIG